MSVALEEKEVKATSLPNWVATAVQDDDDRWATETTGYCQERAYLQKDACQNHWAYLEIQDSKGSKSIHLSIPVLEHLQSKLPAIIAELKTREAKVNE